MRACFRNRKDKCPGISSEDSPRIARFHLAVSETIPDALSRKDDPANTDTQYRAQSLVPVRAPCFASLSNHLKFQAVGGSTCARPPLLQLPTGFRRRQQQASANCS